MHILLVLVAAASMNDPQIATVALTAHLQHAKMVQTQLGKK